MASAPSAARDRRRRRGVTVVEVAVTAPLAFLLILGLIVGAIGVFRYQQVAHLAREGATYAAMHGPNYERRTKKPQADSAQVLQRLLPMAAGLDPSSLDCTCVVDDDANTVAVTLRYQWVPEGYLPASTLSSTSVMSLRQ